jgi:hypothetical protein
MAYGTINADVIQSSVSGVSLGAGNATVFKNRIINGDMRIDQRNAGASTNNVASSFTYCLDRWGTYGTSATKFSIQQNAGSVTPPAGFINYLGITSLASTTPSATDEYILSQRIEGLNVADLGWGTAFAKTITLSFQVYSSLTGTFGGALQNSAQNRFYVFSYSIPVANTWTSISVTIAGDTTGTWLTTSGIGIRVVFDLGTGSTYKGAAGSWGTTFYDGVTGGTNVISTNAATWYVTGVQLEVGSSATGFEYVDYTTQLAMCQRYYQISTSNNVDIRVYSGANGSTYIIPASFPVTMRTNPTVAIVSFSNVGGVSSCIATSTTASGFSYRFVASTSGDVEFTAGFTASGEL